MTMFHIFSALVGILVGLWTYWWIKLTKIRHKLRWIKEVPGLPILGNVFQLKEPRSILPVMLNFCEKYGGVWTMELATDKYVCVAEPEFAEFVVGKMEFLNKTDPYKYLGAWLGHGILTAPENLWKRNRKMLTPAFHFSVLEKFIDTFDSNAEILVEMLQEEVDKCYFDVSPYIAMAALDIICETTMGVPINAQRNRKSDYVNAVHMMCSILIERTYSPIKKFDFLYRLTSLYKQQQKAIDILHAYTNDVIKARKKELENKEEDNEDKTDNLGRKKRHAFLDVLLKSTVDGRPLTDDEIRQEVDTFMFAGHDTTSIAVSFALYCISQNPDVQEKALAEQRSIFKDDFHRVATLRDLQEMKYLEMVIKEAMRMYPSIPYTGRTATRDVPYKDGKIIPQGTNFLLLIFCSNRNPKYFPEPNKFNPERFLDSKSIPQYAYIPFSAGPRNCIGQKFAMLEMKVILSKLLRHFEMLSSEQELKLVSDTVLKSENGINIKLKKRQI